MSMYKQFGTDEVREQEGVWLEYGEFRVKIARAGGANKNYAKSLQRVAQPFRRAIDNGVISNEKQIDILMQTYAESIILAWQTLVGKEWKDGIEGEDGKLVPVSYDSILATLRNLQDLFLDIKTQAENLIIWRNDLLEQEAKN